jgi:hypothetical protein
MKNRPTIAMTASGTNFRIVVASCTIPPSRAPRMLVPVSSQMSPMPTRAPSRLLSPTWGQNTVR